MDEIANGAETMMDEMADRAQGALNGAIDDVQAQLDGLVQEKMDAMASAKEEYTKLMGGEKPSFQELQDFIKFKSKTQSEARSKLGVRQPRGEPGEPIMPKMPIKIPTLTRYPYEEWDMRGACCVCPPCALCPGFLKCPIQCPLCFPLALCGICTNPPLGLPKYNPCCKITYLCKPLEVALARPCLVIHPCIPPCCACPTCCIPKCSMCGFKTIGLDCKCCHCTFACCPSCCPAPCCATEGFTDGLAITRKNVEAPGTVQMKRTADNL